MSFKEEAIPLISYNEKNMSIIINKFLIINKY